MVNYLPRSGRQDDSSGAARITSSWTENSIVGPQQRCSLNAFLATKQDSSWQKRMKAQQAITRGGRTLALKVKNLGFYWPTMNADCESYVQKCDKCQRHTSTIHSPTKLLHTLTGHTLSCDGEWTLLGQCRALDRRDSSWSEGGTEVRLKKTSSAGTDSPTR